MIPIRVIRRRIRSIQSTAKITKAMEMIAASKMKRSQLRVLAARPYAEKIKEVLVGLAAQSQSGEELHPLLQSREVNRVAIIHITPDRGLCGGLNASINRMVARFILEQDASVSMITVGKKGRDFMARYGQDIRAEFFAVGDQACLADTTPISRIVIEDYASGLIDRVYLAYAQFVTTMNQQPVFHELLPIQPVDMKSSENVEYIYEPSSTVVP